MTEAFVRDVDKSDISRKVSVGVAPHPGYLATRDVSQAVLTILSMPQNLEVIDIFHLHKFIFLRFFQYKINVSMLTDSRDDY